VAVVSVHLYMMPGTGTQAFRIGLDWRLCAVAQRIGLLCHGHSHLRMGRASGAKRRLCLILYSYVVAIAAPGQTETRPVQTTNRGRHLGRAALAVSPTRGAPSQPEPPCRAAGVISLCCAPSIATESEARIGAEQGLRFPGTIPEKDP